MIPVRVLLIFLALGACVALPFRRVVNGRHEDPYDPRPWTVWLRKGLMRVHCGGTLVTDSWVVTAASCLNDQINAVIVGDDDVTYDEKTEQVRNVSEMIPHPDFNETTFENDIALIKLETPVELNDEVSTIPILSSDADVDVDDIMSKHCRVAGWGRPDSLKLNQFNNPLKELVVDRVNDTDCDNRTGDRPSSALCFYPFRRPELASTCEGDIGGPYMCKVRTVWHLVGVITAWRTGENCTKGIKGATKILDYVAWIRDHTGETADPDVIPVEPGMSTTTKGPVVTENVPVEQSTKKQTTPIDPFPASKTEPEVHTPPVSASQGTPKLTTPIDPNPAITTERPIPTTTTPISQATPENTGPVDPIPATTDKEPVETNNPTIAAAVNTSPESANTNKPTTAAAVNTSPESANTNKPTTVAAVNTTPEAANTNKPTTVAAVNTTPEAGAIVIPITDHGAINSVASTTNGKEVESMLPILMLPGGGDDIDPFADPIFPLPN